jgi:serine/threonine protein kinase/Tol biopolymer transport system component
MATSTVIMSLAPGVRLGAYEIVTPLGAGGMGEVYRARDTRVGRDVAIKILPAEFSADPERLIRFEQEARASAALNHPNILVLFDVGQHHGAPFIVSELLEGQTLRERLQGSPLAVRKAVELAIQIAQGLAAAHEKGMVHRDLKPENVFITSDGRAKILDFGLAKLTQPEPALSGISVLPTTPPQTVPGVVLGTIGYMSPEQVRGHAADHRSDIFALGALLYEMLSGRRAFGGDTPMDAMSSILKEDPPDLPSTGDRSIPPALARIVDRCFEKNPVARFQSTRDLAFALEGLSTYSGSAVALPESGRPPARVRSAWTIAAAATLALIVTVPFAISHLRESTPLPQQVRFTIGAPEGTTYSGGSNPGIAYRPAQAVSPDGRHIVFLASKAGGAATLWIRSLDSLAARALPGTEGANFPFWSPDSRFVGFFAAGKVKKIDWTGGPAQTVCSATAGEGGTWNADGVIVFAASAASNLSKCAESGGGEATAVTKLDETKDRAHKFPQFLPDGRRFIFLATPANEIRLGSLDSPDTTKLLNADSKAMYAPQGFLVFVRNETLMAQRFDPALGELGSDLISIAGDVAANASNGRAAFFISEGGVLTFRTGSVGGIVQPTWFDRAGGPSGVVGEAARYLNLTLSPDGSRAVVASYEEGETPDLWTFDVVRGVRTKFTLDSAIDIQPVWSPKGDRVVFASARDGATFDLYMKNSTGTASEEILLDDDSSKYPFSWSPDGEFILYATAGAAQDLWVLSLSDRKPRPYMQTPYSEFAGRFSPDGRWIAYRSNESGQADIYVAPFPGPGEKTRISSTGAVGGYPRWRGDGRELFYMASDNTLMAVAVDGRGSRFQAGQPQPLFPTRSAIGRDTFDISADGQRALVLTRKESADEELITVVLNWHPPLTGN